MNPKLRSALDSIDALLLDGEINEDLWLVLAALRGPDQDAYENGLSQKTYGTCPVRRAAFPQLAAKLDREEGRYDFPSTFGFNGQKFEWDKVSHRDPNQPNFDHFESHLMRAARILELQPVAVIDEEEK